MGFSYSRSKDVEKKEWYKNIERYIKKEWSKGYEFYCFTLLMNDYRVWVDEFGNRKREWGSRSDYEVSLKFFYNLLNRKLYGNNWNKKGKGIKGFICFYEEDGGIRFISDIGKMNKVKNSHFHIIIKKEKDISELKLRECIKNIWIFGKNRWNRKFNEFVDKMEIFDWEKDGYIEYIEDGKVIKEKDNLEEEVVINGYWMGCKSFKFEELYYNYFDVMDKDGNVKREKYSWLNYVMKGKWKKMSDMSFDIVRNLREEEYEKLSLNSRMD